MVAIPEAVTRVVARLTADDDTRARWAKWVLCVALAVNFLVSRPLWFSARPYPTTPVLAFLTPLPVSVDWVLFSALFVLLAAIAVMRRFAAPGLAFIALCTFLAAADQSRWHPWFYWFVFMMLALVIATVKQTPEATRAALQACRVLMVGSYFWAGVQKINVTFFYNLFPWMLSAVIHDPQSSPLFSKVGFAIPIIELSVGLLLFVPALRRWGVLMAVGTHLIILVLIGPLGHNVNANVWPWNAALIALVVLLFARDESPLRRLVVPSSPIHGVAVALFWIAPLFTFFDAWDAYLGFSLYSGTQRAGYIQLDAPARAALPPELARYVDDKNRLLASKWSMGEVRTPDYAEPRIYARLHAYVCEHLPPGSNAHLVIMGKPNRLNGEREQECDAACR